MKIVQINAVYEYSSTGRTTTEMHRRLCRDGYESFVFCANKSIPEEKVYYIGSRFEHKIHALLSRILGRQGYYSRRATKHLTKQLCVINPDVVILRNLHSNFINLPILFRYLIRYNIPTICVLHDCWFYTGHCYYYVAPQCKKWLTHCASCPEKHSASPSLMLDWSSYAFEDKKKWFTELKNVSIVGVSDWVTNEARRSVIFSKVSDVRKIYNWIDLSVFYPRNSRTIRDRLKLNDDFVVISVSQGWSEKKGLFVILDVARRMPDVKFVLVGSFDYEGEVPDNVISVGLAAGPVELAEYYSMADAMLVCSFQETFGKVSAEALACGTPVIANDSTANPEIAGDACGISVHNNNRDEIVSAIQHIQSTGKDFYTAKCVERAQTEFNFDKQIEKYYELFSQLTKEKDV